VADFSDIPGTVVFTGEQTRKGYHLNQFCMSLMRADNRASFKADPESYLDAWSLTPVQRKAVLERDYNSAIAEGGNIYFLSKIIFSDGLSMQHAAGEMTGMSTEDYRSMMVSGGRSPHGWRSIEGGF
jgi:protocatechuate 4,5-dioxygenase alpha chain